MTDVTLKVKNPKDPSKMFEGKFLVDSGATYTVVPANILEKLGIEPYGKEEFSLADVSRTIKRKVGGALYEYDGRKGVAPVVFGKKGDSQLLGAFTLEALGLTLDSLKRRLYKARLRM